MRSPPKQRPLPQSSLAISRIGRYFTAVQLDQIDYDAGWRLGVSGEIDPLGRANWAMWRGWRDGAAARHGTVIMNKGPHYNRKYAGTRE